MIVLCWFPMLQHTLRYLVITRRHGSSQDFFRGRGNQKICFHTDVQDI
jgi:hypothetical protein